MGSEEKDVVRTGGSHIGGAARLRADDVPRPSWFLYGYAGGMGRHVAQCLTQSGSSQPMKRKVSMVSMPLFLVMQKEQPYIWYSNLRCSTEIRVSVRVSSSSNCWVCCSRGRPASRQRGNRYCSKAAISLRVSWRS